MHRLGRRGALTASRTGRPTRRRSVRAAAVGLGIALVAASCGTADGADSGASPGVPSSGSASGSIGPTRADADLVIWAAPENVEVLTGIAEEFGDQQGVDVAVQGVPGDRLGAFLLANAAGTGPDVLLGPHEWIGALVQNGAIEPVRLTEADQLRYSPIALDGVTHSEDIYGLPYGYETLVLFRNTDLVTKAPRSIEELASLAQDAGTTYPLCLPVGEDGDAYHLQPLYSSAGGYLFGRTADGGYNVTDLGVGKEGSLTAATKLAELGASGVLDSQITAENFVQTFIDGDCAFLQAGPWALDDLRSADVPYALSPTVGFDGMEPARAFTGVRAYFVASKGSGVELARKFVLDAANSPDAMRAMYDNEPRPPAMTQVLNAVQVTDPDMRVLADAAAAGQILPDVPAVVDVWGPLGQAEAAIIDGADPVSTMLSAGATISGQIS